jgi:hypothetical protein
MPCEWTLVSGFKIKLNDRHAWCENHVLDKMTVSREGSDERPHELIAEGFLSLHQRARNLKDHIVSVVRQNAILVHS